MDELAELVGKSEPAADRRKPFAVRRFAGPLPYVEQMDPIRVAHVTDLHVGRVTPMEVQRQAIRLVNAGAPDLVVLTGDFVCHSQLYLDALTELMTLYEAPVMAVLGNHDHWSGGEEVRDALLRGGVEVLSNANTTITLRHQRVQVVGLDDAYTGHADLNRAVKGLRHDLPALGLSHIAEEADELWEHGVPLVLSGHTHGGQVTLAGLHELMIGRVVGHRYVHGLYGCRRREQLPGAVYVGAGVGAAVVPLRLGDRGKREVTFFELGVHPGAFDEHHDEQPPFKGRKPTAETRRRRAFAVEKKRLRRERRNGAERG